MTQTLVLFWDYWWLAALVTAAAVTHYFMVDRYQGVMTLDGLFTWAQWVMVSGTLVGLDSSQPSDSLYAGVVATAYLLYVVTSIVTRAVVSGSGSGPRGTQPLASARERRLVVYRPTFHFKVLLGLAILITVAYYVSVGYNVFLLGLQGLASGSSADYTTLRLDSYATSRYLFPGYVNQFKNTILPALSAVTMVYLFHARRPGRWIISGFLLAITIFGILGTGQRSPLILFTFTLVTYLFHVDPSRFKRRALVAAGIGAPFLLLATYLLGRSSLALQTSTGLLGKVQVLGYELLRRFFMDGQWSGQMAFRYTSQFPVQDGAEWKQALLGILPGNDGSRVARDVFQMLYGTDRGTAPPSLWGSVYYNFGWAGVIVIPLVLGVVFQVITFRATDHRTMSTFELFTMAGFFAVAGNWIAGGPDYFLNAGAVTYAILWWIARHSPGGSRAAAASRWRPGERPTTDGVPPRTPAQVTT
jgi:oligosaccharide repeat unit polymerase